MNQAHRNIEIKIRCNHLEAVVKRAERLGAKDMGLLLQQDTFFKASQARLKLRDFGNGKTELISYCRPNTPQARGSDYCIAPVTEPATLLSVLEQSLGISGTVKKKRQVFIYKNTRIHLDEVEGLGNFVELETVILNQSDEEALSELKAVALALDLDLKRGIPQPYVELLNSKEIKK